MTTYARTTDTESDTQDRPVLELVPVARPKAANPRSKIAHVQCSATERQAWQIAADRDGRSLSDWLLRRAAGLQASPPEPTEPAGKPVILGARVPADMLDSWRAAAEADGRSLSAWIHRRATGIDQRAPTMKPRRGKTRRR